MSGLKRINSFALLPRRVLINNRRWVEGIAVVIRHGIVQDFVKPSKLPRELPVCELPQMALLPAWINSHTHLEYTDSGFKKPARPSFTEWLEAVTAWKQTRKPADIARSLKEGVRQCLAHGVAAVGDHYSAEAIPAALLNSPLKGVVFHELLGLNPAMAKKYLRAIKERRRGFPKGAIRFGIGLHAPYSVSEKLLTAAVAWARSYSVPLSMHVGESREEAALFRKNGTALQRWLEKKTGLPWPRPVEKNPFSYLARIGLWKGNVQAVHMNLLRERDMASLPQKHVCMVTCPKSHAYFDHPRPALETLLAKKYCVAIGTDSLASNNSLDMLEELRVLHRSHPKIPLEMLWDMATVHGAMSLGLPHHGKIAAGFHADLIGIPATATAHPFQEALAHKGPVSYGTIDGDKHIMYI